MKTYPISNRNRVKRISNNSDYSKETVHAIIDEALFCHLGIIHDGKPVVIPTIHARMGDHIVFHGSNASRLLKISNNNEICVTITLLDGLVMARSLFNSSMNYRSAVIFGKGEIIKDHDERMAAFKSITDHIAPGRWDDARQPNNSELKQTSVVRMPIDEASAKFSMGPPDDEDEDYALDYWAGVIPINQTYGEPESDPILQEGITIPDYLKNYCRG
jgi:nitroimidazol reductase NimA-like FMN-containing flavoprotein (pyridoxamine 5'-phosphate oxidase superfamily)